MAIRFQIRNTTTNTTLASYDLPDGAQARLQALWAAGPGTAAENALRFMVRRLYDESRERAKSAAMADELAALQAAEANEGAAFDTDFPPPVT
jgi:hypothetical protein